MLRLGLEQVPKHISHRAGRLRYTATQNTKIEPRVRCILLDLLINNGLIVDGSGNPGFYGSVGVNGETVHIFRGDSSGTEAARVIDATSKVVCPGFIDVHAHSGLMILAEPEHHPKVRQGITTELVGVDGNSYAPFTRHEDFLAFFGLNSGLRICPEAGRPLPNI